MMKKQYHYKNKFFTFHFHKDEKVLCWFANFKNGQIYFSTKDNSWGYCDAYKKYGIREDGVYERSFSIHHLTIFWYDYYGQHPEELKKSYEN